MSRTVLKECGCGRQYSRETWDQLHLVGRMPDGEGGELELRDCVCKSTIAVDVVELRPLRIVTARDREVGARRAAEYLDSIRPWWRRLLAGVR